VSLAAAGQADFLRPVPPNVALPVKRTQFARAFLSRAE